MSVLSSVWLREKTEQHMFALDVVVHTQTSHTKKKKKKRAHTLLSLHVQQDFNKSSLTWENSAKLTFFFSPPFLCLQKPQTMDQVNVTSEWTVFYVAAKIKSSVFIHCELTSKLPALCFVLLLCMFCDHQRQRRRRSCAEGEGEGQRRDVLEGDQRRHGLDQLGAGEGQGLWYHQLHHPEVLPYSRDQDC